MSIAVSPAGPAAARPVRRATRLAGVYRVECRKLAAQPGPRVLALVCLLGPFVFAGVTALQSGSPADTLYGVWVHSSGFAVSIVVLAFASAWGFPLMAGIVAGDLFSSEDRYGTWKTVLTRSRVRGELFAGKVLAAATFVAGLVGLTAAASLIAGAVIVGAHPLVSLSGTVFSPVHVLGLVLVAWLWCLVPALAFTALAVLLSVATRNGIMGVLGPGLATLVMQLLLLVGTGYLAHTLLLSQAFNAWPPLLSAHPFLTPLLAGLGVSLVWGAGCLAVAWEILRRRDFAGAPVARRAGWQSAVRSMLGLAVVVAAFAVAGNWGPVGVTASRLQNTLTPAFNALTLLQQRELGRTVPPGAHLEVLPSCAHRGSTNHGPGDWVCTLNVMIPQQGAMPFNPTAVSYDVSVSPDGCYKAQSPPAFVGQQLMRDAGGHNVVNPLYTIYGCLDLMR